MLKSLFTAILTALCISSGADQINRATVPNFNLNRYIGEWYEIARFDNHFERDLINVTAQYILQDDGSIRVINRGYNTRKERWGAVEGKATRTRIPGKLRVSFFPMVFTDYNVLAVGENYEWALVGSKSPKYLWILSRQSHISPKRLKNIIAIAKRRGYDVEKLKIES